jgi:hypothetical protein
MSQDIRDPDDRARRARPLHSTRAQRASSQSQKQQVETMAYNAVTSAARSRCDGGPAMWAMSLATGRAFPVRCGKWSCAVCGPWKQAVARSFIEEGFLHWRRRGERVRFLTLTDGTRGKMTVAGLGEAWNRLRATLRASGEMKAYVASLERTPTRGLLHLHVLAVGTYIAQGRLSERARTAGFGRIAHISEVSDAGTVAGYAAKAVHYLHKDLATGGKGVARSRPLRSSRNWLPGGMTAAELALRQAAGYKPSGSDPGPWVVVGYRRNGDLWIRGIGQELDDE